jgi:trans-2,3-dihydro-3-hydroxyanthranilate isomerase
LHTGPINEPETIMPRRYVILDVFTDRPLAGNPLAVVLDAQGLGDGGMQAIAREFNLSETVFVWPPEDRHQRARLRIFNPVRELPFAGHPTVGTAVLLGILDHAGKHGTLAFGLEETVGLVPCSVEVKGEDHGEAIFTLPRLPQEIEPAPPAEALAAMLGLTPAEIGFGEHRPSVYSAGNGFTFVPLASRAAVARAWPVLPAFDAIGPQGRPTGFIYSRETVGEAHHYYARMFAPGSGIAEDPATGSAVAAFAGAIMAFERPRDGEHVFIIEQGFDMGRPSLIRLVLTVAQGQLTKAAIGGSAVIIAEGTLRL